MPLDLENRGLIARGTEGSVWLVFDRAQRRFLALKVVRVRGSEADARALLDDLRTLSSGDPNPWLVVWEDLGLGSEAPAGVRQALPQELAGPSLWMVMRYVHGPSAAELARADAGFGWTEALAVGAQVAGKLARRPEGRAHLDLKPENALIDRRSGEVFLVDAHMTPAGTAAYSAPEQREPGGQPGPAADAFALGRMLRHLAARDVAPDGRPDALPPWPEIPEEWTPERRRTCWAFGELCEALVQPKPEARAEMRESAKKLLELAVAFSGPDVPAVLVASMARAAPIDRLQREAAELERVASALPGRSSRPRWVLLPLFAAIAFTSYFLWPRYPPAPRRPAPDAGSLMRVLGPNDVFPPGHGLWELDIEEPAQRVGLRVVDGPELWVSVTPKPGESTKFDLVPGVYVFEETYEDGFEEEKQFTIKPNKEKRWVTHPYKRSAPEPEASDGGLAAPERD